MRLFVVDEENKYQELKSGQRLHNLDDAVAIAKTEHGKDGGFVVDMENGKAVVFRLNGGQLNFNPNTDRIQVARDEAPGYIFDKENPVEDPRYDSLGYTDNLDDLPEREVATANAYEEHEAN